MKPRLLFLVGMIVLAALSRLVPHPYNFAPITAMALFGGAYFSRRLALIVPLAAMFLSDLVIGFHQHMPVVYVSFALIVMIGYRLQSRKSVSRIAGATLLGSLLFFVVTNFGVWAFGSLYPMTLEGLTTCFTMAIPFFHNQLAGDAVYSFALFGGFALAERGIGALRLSATAA